MYSNVYNMTRYVPSFALLLGGAMALTMLLGGCDSLSEYNDNPNQPTSANPNNVLANAQRDLAFETYGGDETMRGSNLLAQYTTQNFYTTEESRYGSVGYGWSDFYTSLNDLRRVKELARQNQPPNAANLEAIAIITQVWAFQILTDAYGDIPFTEALQGSANRDPAYTPQEDIYPALADSLDRALGLIQTGSGPAGDLVHGGDMTKWSRFANGLKMRLGIRAADANPQFAETVINEANGNALQSNADNTYFQFGTSSAHRNTYYENRFVDGRDDFDASERFVQALKQYSANDPRLDAFVEQTSDSAPPCEDGSGNYDGFPYGMEQSVAQGRQTSRPTCNESRPEPFFSAGPSGSGDAYAPMMYYDEVLITKAEAAARGFIGGGDAAAKDFLEEAIRASVNFYGSETDADISGSSAAADSYVDAVLNDYDANGYEQVIGEQRWIGFYFNNIQGWNTWRRLDFGGWLGPPTGGPAGDLQGRDLPIRIDYPQSEFNLNERNVTEAANRQFDGVANEGPGRRIWWDTEEPPSEVYQP